MMAMLNYEMGLTLNYILYSSFFEELIVTELVKKFTHFVNFEGSLPVC
jgi:hypothetical protein